MTNCYYVESVSCRVVFPKVKKKISKGHQVNVLQLLRSMLFYGLSRGNGRILWSLLVRKRRCSLQLLLETNQILFSYFLVPFSYLSRRQVDLNYLNIRRRKTRFLFLRILNIQTDLPFGIIKNDLSTASVNPLITEKARICGLCGNSECNRSGCSSLTHIFNIVFQITAIINLFVRTKLSQFTSCGISGRVFLKKRNYYFNRIFIHRNKNLINTQRPQFERKETAVISGGFVTVKLNEVKKDSLGQDYIAKVNNVFENPKNASFLV